MQHHEEFKGKTFQLTGPAEYSYKEVVEFVSDITFRKQPLIDIPLPIANVTGSIFEELINPFLTKDMVAQLQEDVIEIPGTSMLTMKDLDIECASMDKVAFDYLHRFRKGGHFTKVEGYYGKKVFTPNN